MKKTIIFLFLLSSIFNVNAQINWKTIEDKSYSVKYPSDWEVNSSGMMGTSFILFSPLAEAQDNFKENVNLLIQDLSAYDLDLDKYVEISVSQIKTMITNSNVIESKNIKSEFGEYQKMIYTGEQGMFKLKFEQYYWVINNNAYVLTFTSELDKYLNYKETGEAILNSFVIK
jgi:hypothetical protein